MTYDELLIKADTDNLIVREKNIPGYGGRIYRNRIAIRKDIPTLKEKACVLAEELAHYYLTVGDITDQSITENRKQEYKARLRAYNSQIGIVGIIRSYEAGCHNTYEMAEYLDVTEEFLKESLDCYRKKYGEYIETDNYIVYFEPRLGILKLI